MSSSELWTTELGAKSKKDHTYVAYKKDDDGNIVRGNKRLITGAQRSFESDLQYVYLPDPYRVAGNSEVIKSLLSKIGKTDSEINTIMKSAYTSSNYKDNAIFDTEAKDTTEYHKNQPKKKTHGIDDVAGLVETLKSVNPKMKPIRLAKPGAKPPLKIRGAGPYEGKSLPELRALLKEKGLHVSGTKPELLTRLATSNRVKIGAKALSKAPRKTKSTKAETGETKAATKASTKASTKVAPKAATKASTKASTKVAPKAAPKAATKASTKVAPKAAPKAATKASTKVAPKGAPKAAPKASAKATTKEETKDDIKIETKAAPKANTKVVSKDATKVAPKASAKGMTKVIPKAGSKTTSNAPLKTPPKASDKDEKKTIDPEIRTEQEEKVLSDIKSVLAQ